MGESKRRKKQEPLYGVVPKTGVVSPLWLMHKGVLFLVGQGDSIACLPASNMVIPNEEQLAVLEDILSSNPTLLPAGVPPVTVAEDVTDRVETRTIAAIAAGLLHSTSDPTIKGPSLIATPVQQPTFDLTAI